MADTKGKGNATGSGAGSCNGNGNGNGTFQKTVESLMTGMDGFLSSKTVVGEPVIMGDTILLPLVDVTFGMGAGAFLGEKKKNSGGGMGAKISPSAVLVIQNGATRMVSVKNQDGITKLLDMLPDLVHRFMDSVDARRDPDGHAAKEAAREAAAQDLKEKLHIEDE